MSLRGTLLLLATLAAGFSLPSGRFVGETPTEARAAQFAAHDTTAYTLPPAKLAKAVALDRTGRRLEVAGEAWMLGQLMLLLALGVVSRMQDFAVGLSKSRWVAGIQLCVSAAAGASAC